MSAIVSLAELESCLRRRAWQSRSQLEKQLGGNTSLLLSQGIQLGTIVAREGNEKMEYAMRSDSDS
ncbi:MAG TPA: hypothetical protein VLG36_04430 [Candidatus Chromulinivoraceae bacterium]|nr:hypothetical protein [Candidatus Chromulinivoraceae bacterium]